MRVSWLLLNLYCYYYYLNRIFLTLIDVKIMSKSESGGPNTMVIAPEGRMMLKTLSYPTEIPFRAVNLHMSYCMYYSLFLYLYILTYLLTFNGTNSF